MSMGRKVLFSLIPVVSMLLVGECGTRLVGGEECEAIEPRAGDWETMVGDAELLWRLEPDTLFESPAGTTRINSVGLREALEPSQKKSSGELRILVTGDSSIYGWGVRDNETYAVYLERELRGRLPGKRIEVINLGVPGYSTEQTLRLLEKVGWSYEPDLVVVSNIFSDCNIDAFQDRAALKITSGEGSAMWNSRLYCAAYMPWIRYQAGLNQATNSILMPGIPTGANAAVSLETIDTVIDLSRVPLQDYLDNLDTIRTSAEERGATMLLAPLAQEWDVGIWNVPMPPPTAEQVLPWFPYRDAQKAWAEERGIGRVYFPDVFAEFSGQKQSLFVDNMHPSPRGTAIMATAVAEHLAAHPELLGLDAAKFREPPAREEPRKNPGGGRGRHADRPPGTPPGEQQPRDGTPH
ncbi:MAG: lysophospholipase L1-like esterase [Myxococcota bacterium]